MKKARFPDYLLGFLCLSILVAFVIYPLVLTTAESFHSAKGITFERYVSIVDPTSTNLEALFNSIILSILSVVFAGVVGTGIAYLVNEFEFPLKSFLRRVAVLPIALPPLVGVMAFLFLYGESGILPRALKELFALDRPILYVEGFNAVLLVHTYSFYVYFYLFCSALIVRIDPSVIEAATNLGSSRWRTFRKVVLPLLSPALIGASLLTFMASMASFSAPLLFASEKRFLTLQIYNAKLNGDMGLAATHSVVLVLISIVFLFMLRGYSANRSFGQASRGVAKARTRTSTSLGRIAVGATALLMMMFILLPVATIILVSFAREGSWTWQLLPTSYTLRNYFDLLTVSSVFRPIENSGAMAILATSGCAVVGITIAFLATRRVFAPRLLGSGIEILAVLPFAIPGTVVALGFVVAFNSPSWLTANQVLVGTFWILPLAYFVRHLPFVVRSVSAGFLQLDKNVEEAAHNLGAGQIRTLRKVLLPLILPSIASGTLLALIASLGEFVSSILLYTYDNRPISVEILSQLRLYNFGSAAAYGVLLLALVLLVTSLATRWLGDKDQGNVIAYG